MENNLTDKIVDKIEAEIAKGTWKPGEYILPTRALATQENVSRGIITAAISILVGKGVLERVPRHGFRVLSSAFADDQNLQIRELAEQCASLINSRRNLGDNRCRPEDLQTIHASFGKFMDDELLLAKSNSSTLITQEDAELYAKGIRCAGWSPDKYTLFKCNLTSDVADLIRGNLLNFHFDDSETTFDARTMAYVEKRVHPNDANDYLALMHYSSLIKKASEGDFTSSIDYREKVSDRYRWNRLSLSVSREESSSDIILYLLYQDIDEEKRNVLMLKERTDEDALTGALNRRAFMLQAEQLLTESDVSRQHAFLMLDIDGFKTINDIFGHPVGDSVLSDLSKALHSVLRYGDLMGRIGGDEFMICLKDIPFDAVIEKKATQINELMRRNFDNGATISGSIGITVFPRDGSTYDQLYQKADIALYQAKASGKDKYEFYETGMNRETDDIKIVDVKDSSESVSIFSSPMKKILIVDDIETNRNMLTEMIKDEYTVLQAKDGRRALLTLRRYGAGISAVLLDLFMPGMSGFEVLKNMQHEPILKSVPVIIVSGADEDDAEFKAIEMGAIDFIKKPIDQRILKIRLQNSINKQENDRLHIQNAYLQLQGEEEQRYRHIVQNTGTVVIEHDWVNSVFTYDKVISQYLAGTYDHRPLWRILLSDMVAGSMDVKAMQNMIYNLATSHTETQSSMRIRLKTCSGKKHWFQMKALKILDEFNITNKLLITLNDINDSVLSEEKLRHMAEYDSLTGLYNRNTFLSKADELIHHGKNGEYILSVSDIDGFKVFNHLYGHDEGDRLLIYIARHLDTACKKIGGICGRIQSDMFVSLHPSRQDCIEFLSSARLGALTKYNSIMNISTCTGKCFVDDITLSMNTIIDRAMLAHQNAKGSPNRNVVFTDEMQKKLLHDQEITSQMELALLHKEFEIYFQPIYDYASGQIVTAEALVRWHKPNGTIILPDEFIPLFEQNGFIVKLDAYIWSSVCEYISDWTSNGVNIVPISVNVSRMDMYNGQLVPTLSSLITKYNISPSSLRLEITESAYMKSSELIISQVEELQKIGFVIEMDDFGSGYSSLNVLSEVPVNILKLDMKFLVGEDKNGRKRKIMGDIIHMAKSSGIDVIAEGVETIEQADFLISIGCTCMQGYYFSKPVVNADFAQMF